MNFFPLVLQRASMTESEMQPSDQQGFLRFMGSHLVALTGRYRSLNDDGSVHSEGNFVFSGFALFLHDQAYWVTAGHCLKESLDKPIAAGRLEVIYAGFMDCFGTDAVHPEMNPFEYEPGCGMYVYDKHIGLDFGLIPLSDLYRQGFEKNGVKFVTRENWLHQPHLTFDGYMMYGFPEHEVIEGQGDVDALVRPVLIAVEEIDARKIAGVAKTWFVGRLPPEANIKSIKGMSGGPIFGFRRTKAGQWVYHVVALQSWWKPDSRIIFGCPLFDFAERLHQLIDSR